MKVVIDTNVFVSRFLSPVGPPARLFDLLERRGDEILISTPIISEYEQVLHYPHIQARHGMSPADILSAIDELTGFATLVDTSAVHLTVVSDASDDKFLECAIAGGADYVVSGDKHLLNLAEYQGIQILRPAVFIALLAAEDAVE